MRLGPTAKLLYFRSKVVFFMIRPSFCYVRFAVSIVLSLKHLSRLSCEFTHSFFTHSSTPRTQHEHFVLGLAMYSPPLPKIRCRFTFMDLAGSI